MVIHSHLTSSGPPERPPVSLRGIRTSLLLVSVSTFAFFVFFLMSLRQERVNNPALLPTGVVFLSGGFLLLPLAISFLLLSSRKVNGIAAGAGAACGFYGAVLFAAPYALGVMGFFIAMSGWGTGHPDHNLTAAGLALLTFLIGSVAVVWCGVRIGKTHWGAFGMSMGASVLYVLFGMSFLGSASYTIGRHAQREAEQANLDRNMPGILANQRIVAVAACLFHNHMQDPQGGYPASLDPPPKDWKCDAKFAADAVPEHTLAYVAQPDASGRITDFELTAMPKARGVANRNPIMIDNRGLVFVYYPWSLEGTVPKDMVGSKDLMYSQIMFLKSNIERYIQDRNKGLAPAALNADAVGSLGHEMPSIEDNGLRLETRDYETRYLPPLASKAGEFALSAQCKTYGQNCLRSFFADYDGSIHGTSEPRLATAGDPLVPRCEFAAGECPDVDWFP